MSKYLIVYDNHCGVCLLGVKLISKMGLIKPESKVELSAHETNDITCNIDPQRACDEMAVINKTTREIQYGTEGYALLIAERFPLLTALSKSKILVNIVNPIYLLFASNRRIIAPLKISQANCTPTLKKGYRLFMIVFLGIFATLITYEKGEILSSVNVFSFLNGFKFIQVTGVGWILTGIFFNGPNRWDYWGHLSVMAGTAILIQSIALLGYNYFPHLAWVISSMLISDFLMLYMHYKRVKTMQLSQKFTLRWWLILHMTAVISLAQYYLF
jgi:hypothetical protein